MECNKDEAFRAKTIAEGKLEGKDYSGAKKFALKAQNLYPGLEGIAQMLTTIDVYVSAENKISGEVDWYGVLGITPSVDDETLRKQYRKLALVLHPDKNKLVGSDGAFTLLSEAWSLLSDKSKRLAYNQRRSLNGLQQKVNTQPNGSSASSRANGFQSFSSRSAAQKAQNTTAPAKPQRKVNTQPNGSSESSRANGFQSFSSRPAAQKAQNSTAPAPPQQKVNTQPNGSSASSRANGFQSFLSRSAAQKAQNTTVPAPPKAVPIPSHQRSDAFWTMCQQCKTHYEFLRTYLNHVLLCPNCKASFLASETAPPPTHSMSSNSSSRQYHQGSSAQSYNGSVDSVINAPRSVPTGQSSSIYADLQGGLPPSSAGVNSVDPSICSTQEQKNVKRERNNDIRSFFKGESFSKKSRVGTDEYPLGANMNHQAAMGNNCFRNFSFGSTEGGFDARWVHSFPGTYQKPNPLGANMNYQAAMGNNDFRNFSFGSTEGAFNANYVHGFPETYKKLKGLRELTPKELRKMLFRKGQNEIQMKLNEWKSKTVTEASDLKKENVKPANQSNYKKSPHDMNGIDKPSASKRSDPVYSCHGVSDNANEVDLAAESMSVPDPDFHDFDMDRSESSFGDSEVWAAYDDDDGMPRFYALISKVISRAPFKVRLSWLNSKTNNEFSTINWMGSGFYKSCGEFRVTRYEVHDSINIFSHKVKWCKGPRGTIHILPKKGDVWALYSNWSPDWNEHTPDEVIHKYEMTLVLDDYNEEQGISVAPLVKVDGFKTVFYPHTNPDKIKHIPKEEMFRFSHRVPNYSLTGEEVKSAPKDCQELDPAATPVELLQAASEDEKDK